MNFNTFQNNKVLNNAKKAGWRLYPLTDLLIDDSRNSLKIKKRDYIEVGHTPIIDQGKKLIGGYSDIEDGFYKEKSYIVFGDHTRILKYIDFSAFIGADGVKILKNINEEVAITKYLYYFLSTVSIPDTGYNRHFKFLKEVIIPVPKIDVQKEIVNLLDKTINVIDKRQQQIEALSALKQNLFLNLYSNNEVKTQSIKLSELILSSRNGLSRRGNDLDGEIVLRLKDIKENEINFTEVNRISLTEKELNTYKLNDQDLLLVRVNGNPDYVGRCAVFEDYKEKVYFNDHIIRLEINNNINKYFLAYYLNSRYGLGEFRKQINTSAGQYTISRKGLNNIKIVYPNLTIQDELISQFNEIDKTKSYLLKSLKELEKLFQTILQQAFNGELFKEDLEKV